MFYLNNFLGNPFDTAMAARHLIFGGVLDRHPKLEINLPHAGAAFLGLIGRIDHGWKDEARNEASPPNTKLLFATFHI